MYPTRLQYVHMHFMNVSGIERALVLLYNYSTCNNYSLLIEC